MTKPSPPLGREALLARMGEEIVRFQDATNEVDDAAAAVLALERVDLQCVSTLLYVPRLSLDRLAQLTRLSPRALRSSLERIELAGYARRLRVDRTEHLELTEHARTWIAAIWGPLAQEGRQALEAHSLPELRVLARFMDRISPMQQAHAARIRRWLEVPTASRAPARRRGGLSPAALRRVQLFVEAHLDRSLRLEELARHAALSPFHFARAFRTSTGVTPRAFVESRRVEKARQLLRETGLPLAQVAAATGLGTQSRFTTTFRRVTGATPAAYRRG